jgi:hypothetical protein
MNVTKSGEEYRNQQRLERGSNNGVVPLWRMVTSKARKSCTINAEIPLLLLALTCQHQLFSRAAPQAVSGYRHGICPGGRWGLDHSSRACFPFILSARAGLRWALDAETTASRIIVRSAAALTALKQTEEAWTER